MRTSNIRCIALVAAAALSLNVSAQKNVLKAFEKFKTSKVVTNSTQESGSRIPSWRCNVTEFQVYSGGDAVLKFKALQQAFEKDSHDKNMTYFALMKGLGKDASEKEKAGYKKVAVRYNATDDPVVLGANTDYNVLMLRCKSKKPNYRIVVAMEWVEDEQKNCVGTFYEIEGHNDLVKTITISAADDEKGGDDFMARMNFYRSNYTGEVTSANNALLLNMLEYLSTVATHATEQEKNVAKTMMQVMGTETASATQQGIILQCVNALDKLPTKASDANASQNEVLARLRSYRQEYDGVNIYVEKEAVLRRMKAYLSKQTLNATSFPLVRQELLNWRNSTTIYVERGTLSELLAELEDKFDAKR